MMYWFVDERIDAEWEDKFETKEAAINRADAEWSHLSEHDRKLRRQFCVIAAPEDEDGCLDWNASTVVRDWVND